MAETIVDPEKEKPEYCLDCYEKHIGKVNVLIGESLDRMRNIERTDDPEAVQKLTDFVLFKVAQAQDETAAAEEHVKGVTNATSEQKKALDGLAHKARVVRNQLRTFKKSFPQEPEVGSLLNAQSGSQELRKDVTLAIKTFGCGQCLADSEKLAAIKEQLLAKTAETPPLPKPPVLPAAQVAATDVIKPLSELIPKTVTELPIISDIRSEILILPKMLIDDILTAFLLK